MLLFPSGEPMQQHRLQLLRLYHPQGDTVLCAFYEDNLYELQKASPRRYASWLIDQNVSSDGSLYIANVVDPRLLLLPYLEDAPKFCPISQLIYDHCRENLDLFPINVLKSWNLEDICDMNDKLGDDLILYRLSEEKCLRWLEEKVERCAAKLREIRLRQQGSRETAFVPGFNALPQMSSAQMMEPSEGCPSSCYIDQGNTQFYLSMEITITAPQRITFQLYRS